MAPHVRMARIAPRDLLLREATLSDYLASQIAQSRLFVTVTLLNYNTSFLPLCDWAMSLASLQHQMEGRSQLLSLTAQHVSRITHETRTSYSDAIVICSQWLEEMNDAPPPNPPLHGTPVPPVLPRL